MIKRTLLLAAFVAVIYAALPGLFKNVANTFDIDSIRFIFG